MGETDTGPFLWFVTVTTGENIRRRQVRSLGGDQNFFSSNFPTGTNVHVRRRQETESDPDHPVPLV